ncbi:dihydrolipoyl dehydrogenase family protein [Winogradskyella litorisediminis]|uniref:Dihydrolipoyl dehydrogenase family protein n=1 Tax=Winogradskyella litorisediminis TaxID=1156618 RepID=A0ABW3N6R8_9FLAO
MKTKHYDVFVIGSGIAGQTAAEKAAKTGKKVAIADNREYGGTCALRGCDPKKIMLQFSEILQQSKQLKDLGVKKLPTIDWKKVQKFKTSFTSAVPVSTEKELQQLGIDLYHQSPKFLSESEISVEGKTISADKFVIATGLVPRKLEIKGRKYLKTSDDILQLKKIPKSVVFIGSGYVGMEFSSMLNSLGCKVTMIDSSDEILNVFDSYLTKKLRKELKNRGVTFHFNTDVIKIQEHTKNYSIVFQKNEEKHRIKARMIFNTAGRVPAIGNLDLDKANVAYDDSGVLVNNYLQSTTNKNVYACGDVSSKSLPLTPLSGLQGHIVGSNVIKENSEEFTNPLVPSVVFTHPQLASVGYSESEAISRYKKIKVYKDDVSNWYNAKKENASAYAFKIIVNERTDEIVGAHILSSKAAETINLFAMAINNKMTAAEFKRQIFTYPSYASDAKSMLAN